MRCIAVSGLCIECSEAAVLPGIRQANIARHGIEVTAPIQTSIRLMAAPGRVNSEQRGKSQTWASARIGHGR
jgi:hypothetical protein